MKIPRNTRYTLQLTNDDGTFKKHVMMSLNVKRHLKDWIKVEDPYLIMDIWNSSIGNKLARELEFWEVYVHKLDTYWINEDDLIELKNELLGKIEDETNNKIYKDHQGVDFSKLNIFQVIELLSDDLSYTITVNLHDNKLEYSEKVIIEHDFDECTVKQLRNYCKKNKIESTGKKTLLIARLKGQDITANDVFKSIIF